MKYKCNTCSKESDYGSLDASGCLICEACMRDSKGVSLLRQAPPVVALHDGAAVVWYNAFTGICTHSWIGYGAHGAGGTGVGLPFTEALSLLKEMDDPCKNCPRPKESDAKESDAKESDAKESDAKESDSKESDAKESDSKESAPLPYSDPWPQRGLWMDRTSLISMSLWCMSLGIVWNWAGSLFFASSLYAAGFVLLGIGISIRRSK